jgi:hypothetical protein
MTVRVYPLRDTSTMLRRNIKQELRDKVAILAIIGIPVLFLLLFVYVFGGALKDSVRLASAPAYIDYVLPGLIIMTAAAGLIGGLAWPACSRSSPSAWLAWAWPSASRPRPSPRPATGRSR